MALTQVNRRRAAHPGLTDQEIDWVGTFLNENNPAYLGPRLTLKEIERIRLDRERLTGQPQDPAMVARIREYTQRWVAERLGK